MGIFVLDIILHCFAFQQHFLRDIWNIIDIIIILLSIAFVLLDLLLTNDSALKGFLKLRGVFRLMRVFILIRKLSYLSIKKE